MLDLFDPDNGWEFSEKLAEKCEVIFVYLTRL